MKHMYNKYEPGRPYIYKAFLDPLQDELGGTFVLRNKPVKNTAVVQTRSSFTLGLVIGFIMQRFVKLGISFHRLTIDTKQLTVRIKAHEDSAANSMDVEWL